MRGITYVTASGTSYHFVNGRMTRTSPRSFDHVENFENVPASFMRAPKVGQTMCIRIAGQGYVTTSPVWDIVPGPVVVEVE